MDDADVCRICRGEETPEEPLFHPCKCSGSIQFVHQECLLEWLDHATSIRGLKAECEFCRQPYLLRKKYRASMPEKLAFLDYVVYVLRYGSSKIRFVYYTVRAFAMILFLAVLIDATLSPMMFCVMWRTRGFYDIFKDWKSKFVAEDPVPQKCLHSKAPYLDHVLGYVWAPSCLRTSFVHGVLIIASFLIAVVFLWIMALWVLSEQTVHHDLDHIDHGEIAHLDEGDESIVFELVGENELFPDPRAAAHGDEIDLEKYEIEPVSNQSIAEPPKLGDVYTPFYRAKRDVYVRSMGDMFEVRFSEADLATNALSEDLEAVLKTAEVDKLVSSARFVLSVEPHEAASLAEKTRLDEIPVVYVAQYSSDSYDSVTLRLPARSRSFDVDGNRIGRVILKPEADLYVDRTEPVEDLEALARNLEDEEELGIFFMQIFGLFQRSTFETLAVLMNVVVLAFGLVGVYLLFHLCALTTFQYLCLTAYVFLAETPVRHAVKLVPHADLVKYLLFGWTWDPVSLKGRLLVQFIPLCVSTIAVRYTVYWLTPGLLKQTGGRKFLHYYYQFYIVIKALAIMMIETFVFPEFCGALLHAVAIPLVASTLRDGLRWHNYHYRHYAGLTVFLQWCAGFFYMHGLQFMVSACRAVLRPGAIFFIHNTDGLVFLRSMLVVPLPRQLFRISMSAGLYGGMIVFGIGTVTLLLHELLPSLWPLQLYCWPGFHIVSLWWCLVAVQPLFVKLTTSGGEETRTMYYVFAKLWLRERFWLRVFEHAARRLDLESWLFGVPREIDAVTETALARGDKTHGYFVRAPFNRIMRPRSNLLLFTPVDQKDRRLDGLRHVLDRELGLYTVVWRPTHFRWRLFALAAYVWSAVSLVTLSLTLVPLLVGRGLDALFWRSEVKNDLVLFAAGLCFVVPGYSAVLMQWAPRELRKCLRFESITGRVHWPTVWSELNVLCATSITIVLHAASDNYFILFPTNGVVPIAFNWLAFLAANAALCEWAEPGRFDVMQLVVVKAVVEACEHAVTLSHAQLLVYGTAIVKLALMWRDSALAKRFEQAARDWVYLDGTEVANYEPN